MALVQYGGGITNFRGSIAGNTFQRNRAGEIVRARGVRTGRASTKQATALATTYSTTTAWLNLGLGFQSLWNDFANTHPHQDRWGTTRLLSGINYFTLINSNRIRLAQSILQLPPPFTLPNTFQTLELVLDPAFISFNYSVPAASGLDYIFLYTTPPTLRALATLRRFFRLTKIFKAQDAEDLIITNDYNITHHTTWPPPPPRQFYIWAMAYTVHLETGLTIPAQFSVGDIYA